ncbi:hypothetical protein [Mesorhizobium sp. M0859]|uniref:hypothetical protein n=1 Tax=Mesorhizobium sp. M0859 TaxID=2957014 RepID=UPI0033364297
MQTNLISVSTLTIIDAEPRIRDVDLAVWLGFNRPVDIRELVARNRDELDAYGSFPCRTENPGKQGGRPGKAYYLNEGQALVICALSRTLQAAQVRKALIDVFMAYRAGKVVHVAEHRRRLPSRSRHAASGYDANLSFLKAFANQPDAMLSLMAGMLTRLDELESINVEMKLSPALAAGLQSLPRAQSNRQPIACTADSISLTNKKPGFGCRARVSEYR